GLDVAIWLCGKIYSFGYRIDFPVFFRAMGILLLVFAAGLLGDAIQNIQQLGWITFGTSPLWNTAHILSEDSALGDILHTFLGYAEAPTILQGLLYAMYLLVVGTIFIGMTRKPKIPKPASTLETSKTSQTSVTSEAARSRG